MKTHPLKSVDCQLIHKDHALLSASEVHAHIREGTKKAGLRSEDCYPAYSENLGETGMICGDLKVVVTQGVQLHETNVLAGVNSFISKETGSAKLEDAVSNCRHITTVSVQKVRQTDLGSPVRNVEAKTRLSDAFDRARDAELAMTIVRMVACKTLNRSDVEAVYWAPSQYLLTHENFTNLAGGSDALPLYVRPQLFGDENADPASPGVFGCGSEFLIGYRVRFDPAPLPAAYMAESLLKFIAFYRLNRALFQDDDAFSMTAADPISVAFHKTDDTRPDEIVLKARSARAPGIAGVSPSAPWDHLDSDSLLDPGRPLDVDASDLDASDPVDAAILARLAQIKDATPPLVRAGQRAEAATPHLHNTASEPSVCFPKPKGFPRPVSMAELRAFALDAQRRQEQLELTRSSVGLFGRLFGK